MNIIILDSINTLNLTTKYYHALLGLEYSLLGSVIDISNTDLEGLIIISNKDMVIIIITKILWHNYRMNLMNYLYNGEIMDWKKALV